MLDDLLLGARFLLRLPTFLGRPVGSGEAHAALRHRLERREVDFLALAKRAIFGHAASPYRELLRLAGCEDGDLERLVKHEGIEGALAVLFRHGVYLTVDEFKGRRPATRGNTAVMVEPAGLRNPLTAVHARIQTGGSRGTSTTAAVDLAFIRDRAVDAALVFEAWGGAGWRRAVWGVPGGAAMIHALEFSVLENRLAGWFSTVDVAAPGLHPRYRWSARTLRWTGRLTGVSIPDPRYVPTEDPLPVARWMAAILDGGAVPHLHTFASSAARLCQAALEAGIGLHGARFTMASEPTTAARLKVVRQAGAEGIPYYASIESGPIGYGCPVPDAPDDLHVLHDFQAVIQADRGHVGRGLPAGALLISSLRATAPFVMLNVSLGDQAVIEPRRCGCPLERLGWVTHLHSVRSYEKLTAGGMTFLDGDLVRALEEALPSRFGGGPTDYQLVEEELAGGQPLLRLLVHPGVGPLDEGKVAEAFLAAIGTGSGVERVMGLAWRGARLLRVERRPPLATAGGKILHLHVAERSATARED